MQTITHTIYTICKVTTRSSDAWTFKAERRFLGVMIPLCVFGISSLGNVCWFYLDTRIKVRFTPFFSIGDLYLFSYIIVFAVCLDLERGQVYSSSMDSAVRIWDLKTGECRHVLTQHESLIGLLSFSPSFLVSAAADGTLCVWNPGTGELYRQLSSESGFPAAITTFQHDEAKVVSGSNGVVRLWDIRTGALVREFVTGVQDVWRVAFSGRWCVAVKNVDDVNFIDTWDFGELGE